MAEPVTLADAKAQLRVLDTSEDALITSYIVAAREYVENLTGLILVQREVTETRERFGQFLQLNWRPVVSVDPIDYADSDGNAATFADFLPSLYRARVYPLASFPSVQNNSEISITYTAGYAEGEAPQSLVQAILLLVGHWFANRETVTRETVNEVPFAVEALCDQHRAVLV